jgi:4-hydroxy-2-oxoheptanedioate aldolase
VLDGGAAGIVAPYVESVREVEELVGAVKLRPLKGLKLRSILDSRSESAQLRNYLDRYNQTNVLIVNVESSPALENLDALLAVPGLDGVLVGPHDLSCSLEIPEEYADEKFRAAVKDIIGRTRAAGLSAGAHVTYPDQGLTEEIGYIEESDANLVIHSGDILLFRRALAEDIARLKKSDRQGNVALGGSTSRSRELDI